MNRIARMSALTFALFIIMAAGSVGAQFCNFLYPNSTSPYTGSSGNGINNAISTTFQIPATAGGIIAIAILLSLMMLMVIGVVYGVGYAFGIRKLTEFSKTEVWEAFANLLIIVLIFGGGMLIQNVMVYAGNVVASGVTNVGINAPAVTTPSGIYLSLCNNYESSALGLAGDWFALNEEITLARSVASFKVNLNPYDEGSIPFVPGVSFAPFTGLTPLLNGLQLLMQTLLVVAGMYVILIFILFVIFYLFPVFLYVGVVLRALPWTRAAGGSFLALFIAFYIVFPTILYPLSFSSLIQQSTITPPTSATWSFGKGAFALVGTVLTGFSGLTTAAPSTVENIAAGIAPSLVDVVGFILAFIISYDLLEQLGDILGAPSLSGSKLFGRLI